MVISLRNFVQTDMSSYKVYIQKNFERAKILAHF